ncbi:protein unc-45 A-like protein [Carex littledalei]|uniref:Protein unc-45 A-like protein n=1 Tax=Carex littledalei TaxID=544730 RepID=A0A833VHB1_9POAL|nr:protein unc-45 A-like protein [Carex littledalei]
METIETGTAPLDRVEKAHHLYREGKHEEALGLYSEALNLAKSKAQKIALHSNRAACYLKMHDFKQAAEECTAVLELDHEHTGALMLRAQTLVTLKDYQSALFDVNRLMEINPDSEVYHNLHARLKTQISLAPIPESEEEALYENDEDEKQQKSQPLLKPHRKIDSPAIKPDAQLAVPSKPDPSTNTKRVNGWETIPKPKGHAGLDYSRWDKVEDGSSEEESDDDDDEGQPQYRFRVRTVSMRPVK